MRRLVPVLVAVVVAAFVALGIWQLGRWNERKGFNARLLARAEMAPVAAEDLTASDELAYRRARLVGTFDITREFLLLSRSLNGIAGHHVITPLRLDPERAVLVDRGWVPFAMDEPPVAEAAPPDGRVAVEGVLVPSTPRGLFSPRDLIEGDRVTGVHRIDFDVLREHFPYELVTLMLQAAVSTGGDLPEPVPFPPPDEGPHLGYAIQWFLFALTAAATAFAVRRRRARTG